MHEVFEKDVHIWSVGFVVIAILAPTVFVRNISIFSFTYLLGNICILTTLVAVSYVFTGTLIERDGELGPGIKWIDNDYAMMVGFACYAYEGIGVVLPIMQVCECPEKFDKILTAAFITLILIYIAFAELCYMTLGTDLVHNFITQELDQGSSLIIILQMIYSMNLLFSYSIQISPANTIIEGYLLKPLIRKAETGDKFWKSIHWHVVNLQRLLVLFAACYCAIELSEVLDKFLSLLGAMLCGPLAIMMPTLIHLKTTAETTYDKVMDIACITLSALVLVFCTYQVLSQ